MTYQQQAQFDVFGGPEAQASLAQQIAQAADSPLNYNPTYMNNPLDSSGKLLSQFQIPGTQDLSNSEYAQNALSQQQGLDTANANQSKAQASALASEPVKGSAGANNVGNALMSGMNNNIQAGTGVTNAGLSNVANIGNNVAQTQNSINEANIQNQLASAGRANSFNLGVYNSQAGGQAGNQQAAATSAAANSGKK
jgi:hypothetical protein